METSGIVRCLDSLGRLVIPSEYRRILQLNNGDPVEMLMEGDAVTIRKYRATGTMRSSVESLKGSIENLPSLKHRNKILKALNELGELLEQEEIDAADDGAADAET